VDKDVVGADVLESGTLSAFPLPQWWDSLFPRHADYSRTSRRVDLFSFGEFCFFWSAHHGTSSSAQVMVCRKDADGF
jgi:hypothetical protein